MRFIKKKSLAWWKRGVWLFHKIFSPSSQSSCVKALGGSYRRASAASPVTTRHCVSVVGAGPASLAGAKLSFLL